MNGLVVTPTVNFPQINHLTFLSCSNLIYLEDKENYQKRSCRNRYYIVDHQGIKMMSIPLVKGKNEKMPILKVEISYDTDWPSQHLKTIKASYGKSPFFEFYFDQLESIFTERATSLYEFNNRCLNWIVKTMNLNITIASTKKYDGTYSEGLDLRSHIPSLINTYYSQVFEDRLGFITNASALDLLFCLGPESAAYLKKQCSDFEFLNQ